MGRFRLPEPPERQNLVLVSWTGCGPTVMFTGLLTSWVAGWGQWWLRQFCPQTLMQWQSLRKRSENLREVTEILLHHLIKILVALVSVYTLLAPDSTSSDQFCFQPAGESNPISTVSTARALLSSDHLLQAINQFNLPELLWFHFCLELCISFPRKALACKARRVCVWGQSVPAQPLVSPVRAVVGLCFLHSQLSLKILAWFQQEKEVIKSADTHQYTFQQSFQTARFILFLNQYLCEIWAL